MAILNIVFIRDLIFEQLQDNEEEDIYKSITDTLEKWLFIDHKSWNHTSCQKDKTLPLISVSFYSVHLKHK